MSIVTLQFGQCGNQIGQALYSTLFEDIHSRNPVTANKSFHNESVRRWFYVNKREVLEPMSILIDTETKTIIKDPKYGYQFKNVAAKSLGGSANNWAFGYSNRSDLLLDEIMNLVRKEAERCDVISSILSIFSSGGGTGSGIGSRITECVREEYPNKHIINAVVLPYETGEVVTQNYNSLLSLAKIYDASDAIILFENDRIHSSCKRLLSNIDFQGINSVVAHQLAGTFQPAQNMQVSHLISDLTAHPSYKLIQIQNNPVLSNKDSKHDFEVSWLNLINEIAKTSRYDYLKKEKKAGVRIKYITNVLITRGREKPEQADMKLLAEKNAYVPWIPTEVQLQHYHQPRMLLSIKKNATLVSSSNNVCSPLNFILEDAWKLFTYGAYLHHYKKYDVDEQYFLNSFEKLETVLNDYRNL